MTGLLWAELRRFGARPAIRWIATGMLLHVALAVVLTVFAPGSSTLAGMLQQGQISFYAMTSVFLALVAGVLLVTGEEASGGTRAMLTVEPRRGRVYWSKVAAAGIAAVPGVAAAYALLAVGMYAAHARAGALGGPPSDLVPELVWSGVRVLALAVCAAAGGAALGVLVRHWWAAVGLVVVWFLVEETVLSPASRVRDWFLFANADAWVRGTRTVLPGEGVLAIPLVHSAVVLLGVMVVLTLLGDAVFRRRDVR
jgi:ABC-2 type transport system permease protein